MILVPKTDKSVRFCIDIRKVNALSSFDAYPLPHIDEVLNWCGTTQFYVIIDFMEVLADFRHFNIPRRKQPFPQFGLHQYSIVWVVWSPNNVLTVHGQHLITQCICHCLFRWYNYSLYEKMYVCLSNEKKRKQYYLSYLCNK